MTLVRWMSPLLWAACPRVEPVEVERCGEAGLAGPAGLDALCIREQHPRLWWDEERLAAARAWVADADHATRLDEATADPDDAHPFDLAFRGLVLDDAAACAAAIDRTLAYRIDAQTLDVGPCDTCRWEPWPYVVYDWCHEHLSPAQKSTLTARFSDYVGRVTAASEREGASGGVHAPSNNYFWGYLRNEIDWGIAAYGEDARAGEALLYGAETRWLQAASPFLEEGSGRGGVPLEGSQYGVYMQAYGLLPLTSLGLHGMEVWEGSGYHRAAVLGWVHTTLPEPTPAFSGAERWHQIFPFADDERNAGFPTVADADIGDFMAAMADAHRDTAIGALARTWLRSYDPPRSMWVEAADRGGASLPFEVLPLDHYAAGPGMLVARDRWGDGSMVVQLTLGRTQGLGGHDHQDMGSFQIWRAGAWVTKEATLYAAPLDWGTAASSWSHNAVSFRVPGAWGGRPFGAVPSSPEGDPVVTGLASRPGWVWAAVDLSPALRTTDPSYTEEDHGVLTFRDHNPYADGLVREVVFLRELGALVVVDHASLRSSRDDAPTRQAFPEVAWAAEDVELVFNLHLSRPDLRFDEAGRVVQVEGEQRLSLHTLAPERTSYAVIDEMDDLVARGEVEPRGRQWRLEVRGAGPATRDMVHVLVVGDMAEPAVAVTSEPADGVWRVHLSHPTRGEAWVELGKGSAGGGSVTLDGATEELPRGVQSYVVDDEGARWEP